MRQVVVKIGSAAALCCILAFVSGAGLATQKSQRAAKQETVRKAPPPPADNQIAPEVRAARSALDTRIDTLGRDFPGRVGIAVRDLRTGWVAQWQGSLYFPQQSVSKFWVALTALDKADRRLLSMTAPVIVRKKDLTVFHQPIRALIKNDGYTTTLDALLERSLTQSDNTANDFILHRAGGPEAVRSMLERSGIEGVRFGPGERLLQSQTAGLTWKQQYSIGNAFYKARAALPMSTRRAAFERYLANPIDGATPLGITDGLAKLKRGELLSPASTSKLLDIMARSRTGRQRLKGGLAAGWKLSHKTGTGQDLGGTVAGYNDVGVITCPGGHSYAVAVMIGRTRAGIPARQKLMNEVVRATIAFDQAVRD